MTSSFKRLLITAVFLTALFALFSISALASEVHLAEVSGDNVRFRSEPNLRCTELGRFSIGTRVLVTDLVQNGEWYEVVHNYRVGYVSAQYITLKADQSLNIGDGMTTGSNVNVRATPSIQSQSYGKLARNTRVKIIGVSGGWYMVNANGQTGYMHADYLDVVKPKVVAAVPTVAADSSADEMDGDGEGEGIDEPSVQAAAMSTDTASGIRGEIVELAKKYLGTPYRYGNMNPSKGFDCSGFTTYIFKQFGYSLNRSAKDQYNNGTKVERANLQLGDLVLFRDPSINKGAASHVGIYIGSNQFIHASSRGGGVKINALSDNYYNKYYVGGRSIV